MALEYTCTPQPPSTHEICSPDSVDFLLFWYPLQPGVVILVFGRPFFHSLRGGGAGPDEYVRLIVESSAEYMFSLFLAMMSHTD